MLFPSLFYYPSVSHRQCDAAQLSSYFRFIEINDWHRWQSSRRRREIENGQQISCNTWPLYSLYNNVCLFWSFRIGLLVYSRMFTAHTNYFNDDWIETQINVFFARCNTTSIQIPIYSELRKSNKNELGTGSKQ